MIKLLEDKPRIKILGEKLFVHNRHKEYRVTYGPNVEEAYQIRHLFEMRNIDMIGRREQKEVLLRHGLINSRLAERREGKFAGLVTLAKALRHLNKSSDIVALLKTGIRLFVGPGTHF